MKQRDQPHDRYFKDLMEDIDIAREFLLTYLDPAISNHIDWNTLAPYDGSLFGAGNKQLYADVVYRAKTKRHETDVFFVLNHQRKPDELLPIRSLEYVLGTLKKSIKQKQGRPGFIVHMTWYNGKGKVYPYASSIFEYFEEPELAQQLLYSTHTIINSGKISDEEASSHEHLGILELFMKHGDSANLLAWLEANPALGRKLAEHKYIDRSLEYVVDVGHYKLEELLATFEKISEKLEQSMLTTAQQLRREGRQQGRQEGRQEGRQQGRQEGRQARNLEIAKNMLFELNLGEDIVQKATGLSRKEVAKLQAASET